MPYTHALLSALLWSLAAGMGYKLLRRSQRGMRAPLLVGLAVFSHWILDLFVDRPDPDLNPQMCCLFFVARLTSQPSNRNTWTPRALSLQFSALSPNFFAKCKEVTDNKSTLCRRLRCEKVALRAAGSRSLRKSSAQRSAVSHQLAVSTQRLAGSQ
jgi:hypothetical protein